MNHGMVILMRDAFSCCSDNSFSFLLLLKKGFGHWFHHAQFFLFRKIPLECGSLNHWMRERPCHCLLWHLTRAFNTRSCREDTEWVFRSSVWFPSMLFVSERCSCVWMCWAVAKQQQTVCCCQEHLVYFACIQCQCVIMCLAADELWEEDAVSDVSP